MRKNGFPGGREESAMCYNCGCGKPGDDMGDPKNITDKTFEEAAKASKQSPKEAKRKTLELLKIILNKEETLRQQRDTR
jgi:hypothetical protein